MKPKRGTTGNSEIKPTALVALLEADGHWNNPKGGGSEKTIRCWSPSHDDKTPSMSVNLSKGVYHCHGCDISGNAYDYLTEFRNLTPAEAMKYLEQQGWKPERVSFAKTAAAAKKQSAKGRPKWIKELPKHRYKHDYIDQYGRLVCTVLRSEREYEQPDGSTKATKSISQFTPAAKGGWWCGAPNNEGLPESDRTQLTPLYNLPYLLERAGEAPNEPIWIVEGEKCVDVLMILNDWRNDKKDGKPRPLTSLKGGTNTPIAAHDLSPLYNSSVVIFADTDEPGRSYVKRLAQHLADNNCTVQMLLPAGENGYDIADAAAGKGLQNNGFAGVMEWVKSVGLEEFTRPPKKQAPPPVDDLEECRYFKVLGLADSEQVAIHNKRTQMMQVFLAQKLSTLPTLITIAPLEFWHEITNNTSPGAAVLTHVQDAIFSAACKKGLIDTNSIYYGRGAVYQRDSELLAYNLGDCLLLQDSGGYLTKQISLGEYEGDMLFSPGPAILPVNFDAKQAKQYCLELHDAILKYRWATREDGRAFIGWLVTSIIGGALEFRPHLWLLSSAGSGKSWLMSNVVNKFLDNMCAKSNNMSVAGLANATKNESLAVYIDEDQADSTSARDRWQEILQIIRASSGGGSARIIANVQGGTQQQFSRFSVLISSTSRPRMSEADDQRFFPISLSAVAYDAAQFNEIADGIRGALTKEKRDVIISYIIQNVAHIVARTEEITNFMNTDGRERRDSLICGALNAACEFMSGYSYDGDETPITRRHATIEDKYEPLRIMLREEIRLEGGSTKPLAECLQEAFYDYENNFVNPKNHPTEAPSYMATVSRRCGFYMLDGYLVVALNTVRTRNPLGKIRSRYNISEDDYFRKMPVTAIKRMMVAGMKETMYRIPHEFANAAGFMTGMKRGQHFNDNGETDD